MNKAYTRINFQNDHEPALNEDNLNAMSEALDTVDTRLVQLAGDVIEKAHNIMELSENPPYIGANGNWWTWDTDTGEYVDSGIDASITVEIADITMLSPTATPYVTNTGTDTDPIFHLFIPRGQNGQTGATPNISVTASVDANTGTPSVTVTKTGTAENPNYALAFSNLKGEQGIQGAKGDTGATGATGNGIASIAKTGTSGLVDTYTITFTDGTTTTYTVTNGRDGQGSGDMLKSVYDPNDDGIIGIEQGGTGANTASNARTALGLGDVATKNTGNISINSQSIPTGATVYAYANDIVTNGVKAYNAWLQKEYMERVTGTQTVYNIDFYTDYGITLQTDCIIDVYSSIYGESPTNVSLISNTGVQVTFADSVNRQVAVVVRQY